MKDRHSFASANTQYKVLEKVLPRDFSYWESNCIGMLFTNAFKMDLIALLDGMYHNCNP